MQQDPLEEISLSAAEVPVTEPQNERSNSTGVAPSSVVPVDPLAAVRDDGNDEFESNMSNSTGSLRLKTKSMENNNPFYHPQHDVEEGLRPLTTSSDTSSGIVVMNRERLLSDPTFDWEDFPSTCSTAESVSGSLDSRTPHRRMRHARHSRRDPYGLTEVPEGDGGSGGLLNSLDAGMKSMRRWLIRSKRRCEQEETHNTTTTTTTTAVEWQRQTPPRHSLRQRAQSEPDAARIRQYLPNINHRIRHRRRSDLSPTAANALQSSTNQQLQQQQQFVGSVARSSETNGANSSGNANASNSNRNTTQSNGQASQPTESIQQQHSMGLVMPGGDTAAVFLNGNNGSGNNNNNNNTPPTLSDRERRARMRWIRINRRFQLVITIVALLFSLLLFAILISWVVLTSAYVVSFDKSCDVPLKPYFWLVTLQLVLDVFRSDIMRFVFHWDANSNQRIPCRVIAYNMAYLLYAMLVLRLGIGAVFVDQESVTCRKTAPELFNASAAFISLSMAAWATILCGYLLPFCIVAAMLTCNGYNPSVTSSQMEGPAQPVFPAAYSSTGAPSGCVELLPIVSTADFPAHYPRECCICMEEFSRRTDAVVETACKHVFHKHCCREWLLQARSCPVCRMDIPSNLELSPENNNNNGNNGSNTNNNTTPTNESPQQQIPLGPTGRPVVGLLRMLQHPSESNSLTGRARSRTASTGSIGTGTPLRARTASMADTTGR